MRTTASIHALICIFITIVGSALCQAQFEALTDADWTTQNLNQLSKHFSDRGAVNHFVSQLYGEAAIQPNVGEYVLADLDNDGSVQLIATLDFSGRAFYSTVLVISKAKGEIRISEVRTHGASVSGLLSRIVDLHHDGTRQIILPRLLAPYQGATPIPVIPDVYKWTAGKLINSDREFQDYYTGVVLPQLNTALAVVDRQGAGNSEAGLQLKKKYLREIEEVNKILGQ